MIRRDYTQEIGLEMPDKKVPWPVGLIVLAAIAVAFWCGTRTLHLAKPRGGSETVTPTPASSMEARR